MCLRTPGRPGNRPSPPTLTNQRGSRKRRTSDCAREGSQARLRVRPRPHKVLATRGSFTADQSLAYLGTWRPKVHVDRAALWVRCCREGPVAERPIHYAERSIYAGRPICAGRPIHAARTRLGTVPLGLLSIEHSTLLSKLLSCCALVLLTAPSSLLSAARSTPVPRPPDPASPLLTALATLRCGLSRRPAQDRAKGEPSICRCRSDQ